MILLNQLGRKVHEAIAASVEGVEVVDVPLEGEVDPEVRGEALVAFHRSKTLPDLVTRGVRWVHAFGTGVDGMHPGVYEGRVVTCSRGASAGPISEWAIAAMLAFEKDLPGAWLDAPAETWGWARLGSLDGRTLGLVGLGGIGVATAERALPFGMKVVATRRNLDRPSPVPEVAVVPLDDVLAEADHLVVAAPDTEATRRVLDERAFALVRPGVHVVNVARGTLIDQDALRAALDDGRVARATLDVCDPEPLPTGHWFYDHPKVLLSAHVSWSSPRMLERLLDLTLENIRRYVAGEPLEGVVDPAEGY